jgi:arylformamidase
MDDTAPRPTSRHSSRGGDDAAPIVIPPPRVDPYRGPPPHEKGPPVFLDYDQIELDAAYDQAVYQPNILQLNRRWASNSARVRARVGEPLHRAHGESAIEQLDIFRTDRDRAPIFIFIHGGAWIRGDARSYSAPAEVFIRAGAHYVVPDFVNVADAGGSLFPMAEQVRQAIAWVYRHAESFGGDRERIYLGGQSSGAHLAAVALTTDWPGEHGLPADIIKGGLCTSGMYELAPVRLSKRANYVKFTDEMVEKLSPIRHLNRLHTPLIVSYGTYETPEFIRQAREFAAAVDRAGRLRELIVGENYSHLELPETLCNPYGLLGAAVLQQMGLACKQW